MTNQFDLKKFKIQREDVLREKRIHEPPPRHKSGEKFLCGPVPWNWLMIAGHLSGHAMHVGIGIWFEAGITKSNTIHISPKILREVGVKRQSAYRALKKLENAGLVHCERARGKAPTVKILNPPNFHKEDE